MAGLAALRLVKPAQAQVNRTFDGLAGRVDDVGRARLQNSIGKAVSLTISELSRNLDLRVIIVTPRTADARAAMFQLRQSIRHRLVFDHSKADNDRCFYLQHNHSAIDPSVAILGHTEPGLGARCDLLIFVAPFMWERKDLIETKWLTRMGSEGTLVYL
jgi:hypothetical protein